MAKKMKKLLALVLVLALCAGQVAIPVAATENTEGTDPAPATSASESAPADSSAGSGSSGGSGSSSDNGSSGSSDKPAPSTGGGEPTRSEHTEVTTDPASGSQTTVTQVTTTDPATGTTTESTTTEVVTTSNGGTQTEMNKDWSSTTTQESSETQNGNPTIQTDTEIITTVTGSEDTIETITQEGDTTKTSGQIEGQESTDIDGTTVITTTETGVVVDHENVTDDTVTSGEWTDGETTNEDYAPGTVTTGEWVDGKIRPGEIVDEKTETGGGTITPEHNGDVPLNLKPNETWVTKTYDVELEDVANLPADTSKYTVSEKKDSQGNLIGWTVTYKEIVTTDPTPASSTVTDKGQWSETEKSKDTYINPGDYTVGSTTTGDDIDNLDNGESVTVTYEDIYVNGVYEGYRIIKTTTTKVTGDPTDEAVGTRTDAQRTENVGETQDAGFIMPDKPEEGITANEYGGETTVIVEEIQEDGQPRGYTVTTEIRNQDGVLLRTETRNIYGTDHTSQTTTVTDPTAERTTTTTLTTVTEVEEVRTIETTQAMELVKERLQTYKTTIVNENEVYQLVDTDDGMYFLYQGKMYQVEAIGSHGDATVKTLTPDKDLITAKDGSDLRNKNGTSTGLFSGYSNEDNDKFPDGYDFRYVGNGAASVLRVNYNDGSTTTNHQFALRDAKGNLHYVYCCDLDTSAVAGTYYEIENLKDSGYYSTDAGSDVVDHIRTIATNGFWATEGGKNTTGTLAAVKQLLKNYDKYFDADLTAVANSLTEGQALTATQAALWAFGNKGSTPDADDLVGTWKTTGAASDSEDERNVKALYKLLTSDLLKNDTADTSTDLLDTSDVKGSSITIHGEATNADGSTKTVGGKTVYNTDVTLELAVIKSDLTGNLKVVVMQDGKKVKEVQLVTEDSNLFGKIIADGKEVGASYTIKNLELIEGVNFTLNLEGTQNLKEGVYLYTANGGDTTSQTFVGVASGKRDVDLEVDLVFNVEDPEISYKRTKTTELREDTQTGTQTSNRTDRKVNTKTVRSGDTKTTSSHAIDVVATITKTETRKSVTKEDRSWKAFYEYLLTITRGGDEEDTGRRDGKGITILDEEVPLAKAPKTGDLSGIWLAISGLSLGGVVLLNHKRKEDI